MVLTVFGVFRTVSHFLFWVRKSSEPPANWTKLWFDSLNELAEKSPVSRKKGLYVSGGLWHYAMCVTQLA
jgi:hypothetical protein